VEPANLPTSPSSPQHGRTGAIALILGLALGVGVAFLREHLDDRLRGREDMERVLGASVLAMITHVDGWRKASKAELVTVDAPSSITAEAYRTLRTNLQFIMRGDDLRVLSVTSADAGEGKTTTVANLAVSLAMAGKKVVAVSCDLRRPRLHSFFGLSNAKGVTSVLAGLANLADAVQMTRVSDLAILSSGPIPPNPAELLGSVEMEALLEHLREVCDVVVIDTPPVLAVSDASVVASLSDGVLLVTDAASRRGAVSRATEELHQVGAKVVGGIINNLDDSTTRYYPKRYGYYATRHYTGASGA